MRRMNRGYAVSWIGIDGTPCAGRLDIGATAATLVGATRGIPRHETVRFDEIAAVRFERGRLHIVRRIGATLLIASLDGPGALREVADGLAGVLP